jgi:hypothetical protein
MSWVIQEQLAVWYAAEQQHLLLLLLLLLLAMLLVGLQVAQRMLRQ